MVFLLFPATQAKADNYGDKQYGRLYARPGYAAQAACTPAHERCACDAPLGAWRYNHFLLYCEADPTTTAETSPAVNSA